MALDALNDFDRIIGGIASGNVITGANTLSGNSGKDALGPTPNAVTNIQFMGTLKGVPAGGVDIGGLYGELHINPDGSYSYTRVAGHIYDLGAPPPGTQEVFTYTIQDKNGVTDTATLTIEAFAEGTTQLDKSGTHVGTVFDDFITAGGMNAFSLNAAGVVAIDGAAGDDKIVGDNTQANLLIGGAGDDWLIGGGKNDTLDGGAGADLMDGGAGEDTVSYASAKAGVSVDLETGATGGAAAGDQLISIEDVTGSAFNDILTGDAGKNVIKGEAGNDSEFGGDNADFLYGGAGNDTVSGGDVDDQL